MSKASARVAQMSAALVVVLGVLLLHSLPMTHPPGGHSAGPGLDSPTVAEHSHGAPLTAMSHLAAPAIAAVTTSSATDHTSDTAMGMGMCMAVVTIVAALLLIRHLAPHSDQDDAARSRPTVIERHQSRAPPWAAPSLEKLSILRI